MNVFTKVKISHKIPGAIILLALLAAPLISWLSYSKAGNVLIDQSKIRLTSNLANRTDTLTQWVSGIAHHLETQSTNLTTRNALDAFSKGWNVLGTNKTEYLKNAYTKNNPHLVGSKGLLNVASDGSQYSRVHEQYHPYFHKIQIDEITVQEASGVTQSLTRSSQELTRLVQQFNIGTDGTEIVTEKENMRVITSIRLLVNNMIVHRHNRAQAYFAA